MDLLTKEEILSIAQKGMKKDIAKKITNSKQYFAISGQLPKKLCTNLDKFKGKTKFSGADITGGTFPIVWLGINASKKSGVVIDFDKWFMWKYGDWSVKEIEAKFVKYLNNPANFKEGGSIKLESFEITAPIEKENVLIEFVDERKIDKYKRVNKGKTVTYSFNISDMANIEDFKGLSMKYGFKFATGGEVLTLENAKIMYEPLAPKAITEEDLPNLTRLWNEFYKEYEEKTTSNPKISDKLMNDLMELANEHERKVRLVLWNKPEYKMSMNKKGGAIADTKDIKKLWIQKAIQHKGALRKTAMKKGLLRNEEEKLSMTDLKKLEKMGGKTSKQAHLAETLRKFDKGGDTEGNETYFYINNNWVGFLEDLPRSYNRTRFFTFSDAVQSLLDVVKSDWGKEMCEENPKSSFEVIKAVRDSEGRNIIKDKTMFSISAKEITALSKTLKLKDGGDISAEEFIEEVKKMHGAIEEVTLKDGEKIKGSELMETGGELSTWTYETHKPKFGINGSDKWMAIVYKDGVVEENEYLDNEIAAKSWCEIYIDSAKGVNDVVEEFKTGGKIKEKVYDRLWITLKQKGKEWSELPQHPLENKTWKQAVDRVKELVQSEKVEIRLSMTEGYNNQGHYFHPNDYNEKYTTYDDDKMRTGGDTIGLVDEKSRGGVPDKEVDEKTYFDMLGAVPPIYLKTIDGQPHANAFAVGEAYGNVWVSHPTEKGKFIAPFTYRAYYIKDGKYYEVSEVYLLKKGEAIRVKMDDRTFENGGDIPKYAETNIVYRKLNGVAEKGKVVDVITSTIFGGGNRFDYMVSYENPKYGMNRESEKWLFPTKEEAEAGVNPKELWGTFKEGGNADVAEPETIVDFKAGTPVRFNIGTRILPKYVKGHIANVWSDRITIRDYNDKMYTFAKPVSSFDVKVSNVYNEETKKVIYVEEFEQMLGCTPNSPYQYFGGKKYFRAKFTNYYVLIK